MLKQTRRGGGREQCTGTVLSCRYLVIVTLYTTMKRRKFTWWTAMFWVLASLYTRSSDQVGWSVRSLRASQLWWRNHKTPNVSKNGFSFPLGLPNPKKSVLFSFATAPTHIFATLYVFGLDVSRQLFWFGSSKPIIVVVVAACLSSCHRTASNATT